MTLLSRMCLFWKIGLLEDIKREMSMSSHYHENRQDTWLRDVRGAARIAKVVQAAPMPVYGLLGNPLGLTACSGFHWTQSEKDRAKNSVTSVELRFVLPSHRRQSHDLRTGNFTITSMTQEELGPLVNSTDISGSDVVIHSFGLSSEEIVQTGNPQVITHSLTIADMPFSAQIVSWSHAYQPIAYVLTHEATSSSGGAIGRAFRLSLAEVISLLEQFVRVNNRPDFFARYEAECKQNS
jgi:hypothetical protein